MKNIFIAGIGGACALLLIGTFSLFDLSKIEGIAAQLISSQQHVHFKDCIESFTQEKITDLTITETELNSDTHIDGIIQYKSDSLCGNAGCVTELCVSNEQDAYTHVPFGFATRSLTPKETTNFQMHDLIINNDEKITMIWNGTNYALEEN